MIKNFFLCIFDFLIDCVEGCFWFICTMTSVTIVALAFLGTLELANNMTNHIESPWYIIASPFVMFFGLGIMTRR